MAIEGMHIYGAVLVGAGATAIMDLWALFLRRAFGVSSLNFCLVGRWMGHMATGTFTHANIGAAARRPGECALGWSAHYLIGIVFACFLVIPVAGSWLQHPTLLPALAVGLVTVLIPFFVMQPALGMGVAAARAPSPTLARLKSLMTHAVFGIGLYITAVVLRPVLAV